MRKLNNLQIAIAAISLVACATCYAQSGLMLTTVADFYGTNGSQPSFFSPLAQASDGMLYGTTMEGGAFGQGTIFKTTLAGSLTTLVSFDGTNEAPPYRSLILAADRNFYGTAGGGAYGYGTVYKMDSAGDLTNLFSFDLTNGTAPDALIQGSDGALYGTTASGGSFTNVYGPAGCGTVFKITTNGDFTFLASFNGTNGAVPTDIIQAGDGNFYGVANQGGSNNGFGTVFKMTPDGQITDLVVFMGTNGADPGTVLLGSDGAIYGTAQGGSFYSSTNSGFPNGYGAVFRVTTNGDFSLLASLDGTNGMQPVGLTEVCNGVFYGIASYGGLYPDGPESVQSNDGTIFRVTTDGDLTVLISFGANSFLPAIPFCAALTKATDGNYYGTAQYGTPDPGYFGLPYPGAIFSIRPVEAPILQPLAQGSQLNLSWNAWAGYSYNLMYETNLNCTNWTLLSTISPQTNGPASYSDNIGPDAQRFYTVVLQLP